MRIVSGIALLAGGVLALQPGLAVAQRAMVTYSEGQAALAGQPLQGEASLSAGQVLSTGAGAAELLLTPGSQLRLDRASAIRLVVQDERRTEVAIMMGRAEINLQGMREGGELQVDTPGGVQTLLIQNGLYEFDTKAGVLRVFDGKAAVSASADTGWVDVKAGRTLALNGSASRPLEFDREQSDGFARRDDAESARGYSGGDSGYGYRSGYGEGYGFSPYAGSFGPGYYGGYGYAPYGGFGYAGYGYAGYGFGVFGYPGFYGGGGYYRGFGYGRGIGYPGVGGGRFRR